MDLESDISKEKGSEYFKYCPNCDQSDPDERKERMMRIKNNLELLLGDDPPVEIKSKVELLLSMITVVDQEK
ncbi:MAG: hypothetical protein ACFFD4_11510 [Candidatus Odinarchaeota archaeon]